MAKHNITEAQFDSLIENLDRYICKGSSHNIDWAPSDWDTLHFEFQGPTELGLNFHLAHPYSKDLGSIDYNTIEVRFVTTYPFPKTEVYRITSQSQVIELEKAVMPLHYHYREHGTTVQQPHKVHG